MAPPSPRRSSRARTVNPQSQQSSSSSSGISGRLERSTRSLHRPSSEKSTPSASLSSEPLEDFDETPMPRRRRRGLDENQDKMLQNDALDGMTNASDDVQDEEDEAVRCICGSEDYPGRPLVEGPDAELFAAVDLTAEDVTGFFVQCDICKVWQHGACVGIFSAESSPDEYFCEQCRQDLHQVTLASNGQKYSKFLPLHQQSPITSRAASVLKDDPKSPKSSTKASRAEQALQASKRRSTMNSRDAAYDDEQLLRAIEASREAAPEDLSDAGIRRTKRSRSDSEENQTSVKRQRTASRSASPTAEPTGDYRREDSDDDSSTNNGAKRIRSHRSTKERGEKDERERQRQEAANKRKNRAERRRAEDSDVSEELPLAAVKLLPSRTSEPSSASEPTPITGIAPGTPPPTNIVIGSSHKRTAKSNQKRIRGKNQYTKDRDENDESPARSMSRDIQRPADDPNPKSPSTDSRQGSKAKNTASHKLTMLDMKRRVAAILEFISRTQVDLAAEAACQTSSSSGEASPQNPSSDQPDRNLIDISEKLNLGDATDVPLSDREFRDLNCIEMMDVLTRDMVKWQNHYT